MLLLLEFHNAYANLLELGLGCEHEEMKPLLDDWEILKSLQIPLIEGTTGPTDLLANVERSTILDEIHGHFFSSEKLKGMDESPLCTLLTREELFLKKWNLSHTSKRETCTKAFALDLLSEYMQPSSLEYLCKKLELDVPADVPIGTSKPVVPSEAAAQSALPKKRPTKFQPEEGKPSKRITSFFKPKSAVKQ